MNLKDSYNFVLLGDSISKGVVYDELKGKYTTLKDSYASLLQDKLKGTLINAARFGNTITRGISRLGNDVFKKNPDIVVVEFGGNDCDFNWEEVATDPSATHYPNTEYSDFKLKLQELVHTLSSKGILPVLISLPPIDAERYFRWISNQDLAKGTNILKWLGSVNKIYWWQERYNAAVLDTAQETNTPYIDVRGAFLDTPDYTKYLCKDGIHPNEDGHKLIADRILNYLEHNGEFLLKPSIA